MCKIGSAESKQLKLLTESNEPAVLNSRTETEKPIHTRLCSNVIKPTVNLSKTKIDKSRREIAGTKNAKPGRADCLEGEGGPRDE